MAEWFERLAVIMALVSALHGRPHDTPTPSKGDNGNWALCGAPICLCTGDTCSPWLGGD